MFYESLFWASTQVNNICKIPWSKTKSHKLSLQKVKSPLALWPPGGVTSISDQALTSQWGTKNTFFSAPCIPRGGERDMRGRLRGGPVVVRLGPLLLPGWSARLLRHWIQGNLGPGSLALREVVASCRAWAPSISPLVRRSGLRGGWCWFGCLLNRRRFGATGSRRRAGALRE